MNLKQPALPAGLALPAARIPPVALAAAALIALAGLLAFKGWRTGLVGWDDPDSVMRLVGVRAFLDGRGWFDLLEPRLAPPDGLFMHWSRLVDLPIAGLIRLFEPVLGRTGAEIAVVNLWPPLVFVAFGAALLAVVRRLADGFALAVALALVFLSPFVIGVFMPGRIDHHNVQATLLAWMVAGLVRAETSRRAAAAAGVAAALSLAVGMEMLPLIVAAIGALALAWIHDGDRWRNAATVFGNTFGFAVVALFALTVPPDRWSIAACDAISPVYATLAAFGGAGLAVVASLFRGGPSEGAAGYLIRGGAIAGIASMLLAGAALVFPDCLAGPYAGVDPRLGPIWLDHVVEAYGLIDIARSEPWMLPFDYAPPILALVFAAVAMRNAGPVREPFLLLATLLAGALVLGAVQQRSLVAAHMLSALVGAVSTAILAEAALRRPSIGRQGLSPSVIRCLWVVLAPVAWLNAGLIFSDRAGSAGEDAAFAAGSACLGPIGQTLAAAPAGLVVAPADYGPTILLASASSVLAAPYHRNTAGLLAADAILAGPPDPSAFDAAGAAYLALCPGDPSSGLLARRAPGSLAARVAAGERPDWLEPLLDGPTGVVLRRRPIAPAPDVTGALPPLVLRPSLP